LQLYFYYSAAIENKLLTIKVYKKKHIIKITAHTHVRYTHMFTTYVVTKHMPNVINKQTAQIPITTP